MDFRVGVERMKDRAYRTVQAKQFFRTAWFWICFAGVCGLGYILVVSPAAAQGAREGLLLCGQVMIPSLFPFFVLNAVFVWLMNKRQAAGKKTVSDHVMGFLFRLPGAAFGAMLLGLAGGYPTGAKAAAAMLENGLVTRHQAKRMLLFSVNAGPAFVIGVVGASLLGDSRAGVLLLASTTLGSLAMAFLGRLLAREDEREVPDNCSAVSSASTVTRRKGQSFPAMLPGAVSGAVGGILGVCAWVVVFSTLVALLKLLPMELRGIIPSVTALLEVSNGAVQAARIGMSLPIIAALLGWGGLSVHCQILGEIRQIGLRISHFYVSRAVHAALSAAICSALLYFFPVTVHTAALSDTVLTWQPWAVSAPAAGAMLFFCAFLVAESEALRPQKALLRE